MTSGAVAHEGTHITVRRREIPAGSARCAVFRRTYDASLEEVWDACTNPDRLRRWYGPVSGDLRSGGTFVQGGFGPGRIVLCDRPRLLTIALGEGDPAPDQLELSLRPDGARTVLELEHATTLDTHLIGDAVFDAVVCMGGGYGPRLITLDQHLRLRLRPDFDAERLHLDHAYAPVIESSMAALAALGPPAMRP